jgi:hypothetical protein
MNQRREFLKWTSSKAYDDYRGATLLCALADEMKLELNNRTGTVPLKSTPWGIGLLLTVSHRLTTRISTRFWGDQCPARSSKACNKLTIDRRYASLHSLSDEKLQRGGLCYPIARVWNGSNKTRRYGIFTFCGIIGLLY